MGRTVMLPVKLGSDWHREAAVGVGALGLGCWCLLEMPYTLLGGIMLRRTLTAAAATLPLILSTAAFRLGIITIADTDSNSLRTAF